ncbi:hypothetical protein [Bradyrhizobium sp.]|uniref:hypothetical protein n=1 Tax=Bradyrhizobium sp. TaxID=376 RepID=UPI0025BE7835|nr:hypothetical protein [Bradyrhizobium sp.]
MNGRGLASRCAAFTGSYLSVLRCGQVVAGFAGFTGFTGFLDVCGLAWTGFRTVSGLMFIGLPAATGTASGSDGLKNTLQPGESWDFLAIMQTVTRSTSGISELHSLNASPLHACCCSAV